MQRKESNKSDQELVDKIINVAYGDAGIIDWLYIRFKALTNSEIKSLIKEYNKTAFAVHNLKQEDAPEHIIERVKNSTNSYNQRESFISGISYGFFTLWNKKATPATVFGVIILMIVSFLILREPTQTPRYSKAEIDLAEKQLKQSLAIVGKAFQSAEKSFNEEVLNNQINKKLNRGYYLVNNILIGG